MRRLSVILIAGSVLFILGACHDGGGGTDNSGLPTVASEAHYGATECVDYNGCADPIYLNRRLGEMAGERACTLKLCFVSGDCMFNCPPERLLPRCQ